MRSPADIATELYQRDAHVRQYLGPVARYEVWFDGYDYGSFATPEEAEACIRDLLGISADEGAMLDAYVEQLARGAVTEAN